MKHKLKVYISCPLPTKTMGQLKEYFDCYINSKEGNINELIKEIGIEFDAVVSLLSDKISAHFFESFPTVKIVSNYAVGFNNIDLKAASAYQVAITNTPGVLTDTSADTAFALMMAVGRRIVEADEFVRSGKWTGWNPTQYLGKDIWGSKLGIVGLGRIGKAVVKRAQGFGMECFYWNRTRLSPSEEKQLGLTYLSLEELLATVDFVSIHIAYTPETHHLIDAEKLSLIRKSAFLINTSRGAVIDEDALISALQKNQIAGAGLDVYEKEPLISPSLFTLKNVVLLPHLGSASLSTREKMGQLVIDNLIDFSTQKTPRNIVNVM